jgi:hypothetical protein
MLASLAAGTVAGWRVKAAQYFLKTGASCQWLQYGNLAKMRETAQLKSLHNWGTAGANTGSPSQLLSCAAVCCHASLSWAS